MAIKNYDIGSGHKVGGVQIKIEGDEHMQKALKAFADDAFKKKVLMATYRKASTPFVRVAKSKAPGPSKDPDFYKKIREKYDLGIPENKAKNRKKISRKKKYEQKPGTLKKSIGKWAWRYAKQPSIFLGARFGSRSLKYDGYYYKFLEFGTAHQAAQPFLQPAWQATKGEISNNIRKDFTAVLEKFKRKYGYA
jgi:HK97 gp10 family phage protein